MKLTNILLAAAALSAAACMADLGLKDDNGMAPERPPARPPVSAPSGGYSADEVARHNSEGSCWLVLHGRVYDVTRFVPIHPGGRFILEGCGKDATRLFETRAMGSGTAHSSGARETAEAYDIGRTK